MISPPLIGGLAHASPAAPSVVVAGAALLAFGARFVPAKG